MQTPYGAVPIQEIEPGEVVLAQARDGTIVDAPVLETFVRTANELIDARVAYASVPLDAHAQWQDSGPP